MLTHTDDKVEMEYDQKVTEVCSRGEARNPRRERRESGIIQSKQRARYEMPCVSRSSPLWWSSSRNHIL